LKNNEVKFYKKNPSERSIILFVGRLSLEKGVDILLEAIKIIMEKLSNKNFLLQLIGKGPLKEYCSNFIYKYQLPASIIEPTYKIEPYYWQADIVVLPSRVDPFPLVMLEAGLFQKPFIGSNIDGIAEFIQNDETGILCESANAKKLAKAIQKIIENERFASTLAKNLHFNVIKSYTADKILPKYEELYLELFNG
jgi:glycosyltransferase involved in cell wall biosynthesis